MFQTEWNKITVKPSILSIITQGYKLPFREKPITTCIPPYQRFSGDSKVTWTNVVENMLAMEAIEEVSDPNSRGTYSHMFLRQKANGKHRPIINLKQVNKRLNVLPFKMATPKSVLLALREGDWTTSIDLKDAYFHVPVAKAHRKFLRFAMLERVFQFKTLPFGLAPAPQVFTSLVKILVAWGRTRGIRIIAYLDDWLLHGQDRALLQRQTTQIAQKAASLGWVINKEKSDMSPKQVFEFLGMKINTRTSMVKPVTKRVNNMTSCAKELQSAVTTTARSLLKLQGIMVSLGDIIKLGKLHRRPFQQAIRPLKLNAHMNRTITVTKTLRDAITWWTRSQNLTREVSFRKNKDTVTVVTDASTVGWGGTVRDIPVCGVWTESEKSLHINCLEMLGVKRTLEHTQVSLQGKHLALHTDNTTVKAYLLKQGGTVSSALNVLTAEVWQEICKLNATLSVDHISGTLNVLADRLSRPGQVLQAEWELDQGTFDRLSRVWGTPDVDLFATRFNRKLQRFVSPCPDADAESQDAMKANWGAFSFPYLFPPFSMIGQVLEKIEETHTRCLVVTPAWKGNSHFPTLTAMSIGDPIYLGHDPGLLQQGFEPQIKWYQEPHQLALHAWLVSSKRSKTKDSRPPSPKSLPDPNENPRWGYTQEFGNGSILGFKPTGAAIRSMPLPPE